MVTSLGADGLFRPIFEGCISGFDHCIERRPYHRNCSCALHSKSRNLCAHKLLGNNVTYPMRRWWSEGSLSMMMLVVSNHSLHSTSLSLNGVRPQLCLVEE
ncbi:hypothetical protein Lalb_Chr11g0072841 [Lupinus albus]|uniref:Uncharacterized protein n=1 Tax=Lupinus albus TaxID=3870 RepID=A0A6A4PSP8_LUPAL|nr:hypothetical protein Lalb_Chr11g0072841 [Lupinus albus]